MTETERASSFPFWRDLLPAWILINLFYIFPASSLFFLLSLFTSWFRFATDWFLPFLLGNFFSFLWLLKRYGSFRKRNIKGAFPFASPSSWRNNCYYILPWAISDAMVAVFEVCLLSEEEWRQSSLGEISLTIGLLFILFFCFIWGFGTFLSWLMRCGATVLWNCFHFRKKQVQKGGQSPLYTVSFIFGSFPAASPAMSFYRLSHGESRFRRWYWHWILANLLYFLPVSLGIGLGWLFTAPQLVLSRYFLPLEFILCLYINFLALPASVLWVCLSRMGKVFFPAKNPRLNWLRRFACLFLKGNIIVILPILLLAFFGKYLPASLAFFDPQRQGIRIIPPWILGDYLLANAAFLLMSLLIRIFTAITGHKIQFSQPEETAAFEKERTAETKA